MRATFHCASPSYRSRMLLQDGTGQQQVAGSREELHIGTTAHGPDERHAAARSRTLTHTHTLPHSHSHTHTLLHTLSRTRTRTGQLSHALPLSHTHAAARSYTLTHTHTLPHSHYHTHTRLPACAHTVSHTHTHEPARALSCSQAVLMSWVGNTSLRPSKRLWLTETSGTSTVMP